MHRVRLLRHHKIIPYIVFDGGPLPAKKGTESERKKRRDENLALAKKLAAQGKHTQAREYYVKCVDVTTEMAYQFIKVIFHVPPLILSNLFSVGAESGGHTVRCCPIRGRCPTCVPRTGWDGRRDTHRGL